MSQNCSRRQKIIEKIKCLKFIGKEIKLLKQIKYFKIILVDTKSLKQIKYKIIEISKSLK